MVIHVWVWTQQCRESITTPVVSGVTLATGASGIDATVCSVELD